MPRPSFRINRFKPFIHSAAFSDGGCTEAAHASSGSCSSASKKGRQLNPGLPGVLPAAEGQPRVWGRASARLGWWVLLGSSLSPAHHPARPSADTIDRHVLLGWSFLPYHKRNKPQNTVDLFTCRRGSAGAGANVGLPQEQPPRCCRPPETPRVRRAPVGRGSRELRLGDSTAPASRAGMC